MRRKPPLHRWKTSRCWQTVSCSHSRRDQLLVFLASSLWVAVLVPQAWDVQEQFEIGQNVPPGIASLPPCTGVKLNTLQWCRSCLVSPWFLEGKRCARRKWAAQRGWGDRRGAALVCRDFRVHPAIFKALYSLPATWGRHLVSTRAPEVGSSVCGTGYILNEKQSFLSRVRSGKNRVWFSFQEMTASSPPLWLYCQILINFLSYERKQCVIKSFCRQALFI